MRDYAERIEKKDALQAHPEYLNEQINDHDKAIYAKGWNDCNKEYYNAITELPVASIACTDLSMRLRRTFEADELVNQRILLDAADAIEELLAFAKFVARQAIDTGDNDGVSAEILCRKLNKLGLIETDGEFWMLPTPPKGVE